MKAMNSFADANNAIKKDRTNIFSGSNTLEIYYGSIVKMEVSVWNTKKNRGYST